MTREEDAGRCASAGDLFTLYIWAELPFLLLDVYTAHDRAPSLARYGSVRAMFIQYCSMRTRSPVSSGEQQRQSPEKGKAGLLTWETDLLQLEPGGRTLPQSPPPVKPGSKLICHF